MRPSTTLHSVGMPLPARAQAALDRGFAARAERQSEAAPTQLREKITDRLGLPKDADNATVLAALDQAKAQKAARAAATQQQSAADALYERAYGTRPVPSSIQLNDEQSALYARAWGEEG